MPPETKKIIKERLAKLEEAVAALEEFKSVSREEFIKNKRNHYAAMYALILGIEAICDIGGHILSSQFNKKVSTYKDIIAGLEEVDIIPKSLKEKSIEMTDFRNILIHIYTKIDLKEVYKSALAAPNQFREYAKYFQKFLN